MKDADIVRDYTERVIERLRKWSPSVPKEVIEQIVRDISQVEPEMRRDWGGDRAYIAKDVARERHQRIRQDLASGSQVSEVQKKHGISRWMIYRLLRDGDA